LCKVQELPKSLGDLASLQRLTLHFLSEIEELPNTIGRRRLQMLETLDMPGRCTLLETLDVPGIWTCQAYAHAG